MVIVLKSQDDLAAMRVAGRAVWRALSTAIDRCSIGITTAEVAGAARAAAAELTEAAVCTCVNDEAAFAAPGPKRLDAGDLVTVDVAGAVGGWWADAAGVVVVPPAKGEAPRLATAARSVLGAGLAEVRPGVAWSAVAAAVRAEAARLGVGLTSLPAGHGIGRRLHEGPSLRLAGVEGGSDEVILRPGMVITLEPTVTAGLGGEVVERNGRVFTADGGLACTEERTVAILEESVMVLTGA